MWMFLLFSVASARSLEQLHRLRHQSCSEHDCVGTTTCMGKCISYLQGEPCDVSTSDVELYIDMYYLKKVRVRTTCWESFVTYYIDVLGESEGMTTEEYDRRSQDSLHRVDIVDGKWYGYGRKVEDNNLCNKTKLGAVHMMEDDGFLPTGDIDDMWIRDSAAQVHPLLDMPDMLPKIRKVIEKQAFFIEFDPYANSYGRSFKEPSILGRHGFVTTRNYELDSGAYFFRLVYEYWKRTGTKLGHNAILKLLDVWRVEQTHGKSPYKYDELLNGVGTPVGYTGMTWTGFRPSDDKCTYHYHIPDNVFAAVTLDYMQEMGYDTATLRQDIIQGIHKYGVKDGMYCYEVDGLGGCNMMDDANVPSLLSLPYLDPKGLVYNRDIYEKTREFILSLKNPYYYSGKYKGIGSPHTPKNHVWHLSLIMQAILGDSVAHETLRETASESGPKASVFHESFHVDNPKKFTRKWFGWADALYYEMCTPRS